MKILAVHNRYREIGGEDFVVRSEADILSSAGHIVMRYERDNREIEKPAFSAAASLALQTIWSRKSYREVSRIARGKKPDVAHFHNTLPLISPSAHWACKRNAVPVVQTLHNYRLLCPAATFLRAGKVCELCLGKAIPWPGVVHACYRDSRAASAAVASMLSIHRLLHTWTAAVDVFIALSEFAKTKFVAGGLPAEKIHVKPNFVYPDPGAGADPSDFALFVGRLSPEKGPATLLAASGLLGGRVPLRMIGDGPLRAQLQSQASREGLSTIRFEGALPREKVFDAMKRSRFLVVSSECYENFPMAIVEAFACGVPAIVPDLGACAEIVADGCTGLRFNAGDAADLAAKIEWAWTHPLRMREMGLAARAEFAAKYTAPRNLRMLLEIYERVISGDLPGLPVANVSAPNLSLMTRPCVTPHV